MTEPEKPQKPEPQQREPQEPESPEQPEGQPIDLGEAAWEPEPLFPLDAEPEADAAPEVDLVKAGSAPDPEMAPPAAAEEAPAPEPVVDTAQVEPTAVPEALEPAPAAAPRSGLVLPVVAGLTVLLLLLTGFLAYRVVDSRGPAPVEQSRKDAVAAGRDAARLVFSYDYRRLDKDFKAALATTTGAFRKDYETTTKKLVGDVAPRYKAVLVAEVSEAAVITATEDRVLLLVFLNVQSQSSLTTAPKITPRRLKMTLQREGERWLVADVDTL